MSIMTDEELEAELERVRERVRANSGNVVPFKAPPAPDSRPDLLVDSGDLPATTRALRDRIAETRGFLDNGNCPVYIVKRAETGMPIAKEANKHRVVLEAHRVCRPVRRNERREIVETTLPERVAELYLAMAGEWNLPPFNGISCAPLLTNDGGIRVADGYDKATGLWCHNIPTVDVPASPTLEQAKDALLILRDMFRTFPFADARMYRAPQLGLNVVDLDSKPGLDEASYLAGLMTGVCRQSLDLAPGLLITAPPFSGAGTGKGLLAKAASAIGSGFKPDALTAGHDHIEMDKRLTSELIRAAPSIFLDNVNGKDLRSDTLASALTERPARTRVMGTSKTVLINSAAFITITGNGLQITEDLARRFIEPRLDAKLEDPESRPFKDGATRSSKR
jgi:hypothetical protein